MTAKSPTPPPQSPDAPLSTDELDSLSVMCDSYPGAFYVSTKKVRALLSTAADHAQLTRDIAKWRDCAAGLQLGRDQATTRATEAEAERDRLAARVERLEKDDDAACALLGEVAAARNAAEARVAMLTEALEGSPCPYPVDDDNTVAECIAHENCGCNNRAALAPAAAGREGG